PLHEEAVIGLRLDVLLAHRPIEARPAGAGVELVLRVEQRLSTGHADELARVLDVVQLARERRLGPLLAYDLVLLGGELLAALLLALLDLLQDLPPFGGL